MDSKMGFFSAMFRRTNCRKVGKLLHPFVAGVAAQMAWPEAIAHPDSMVISRSCGKYGCKGN